MLFHSQLHGWASKIVNYFHSNIFSQLPYNHAIDIRAINDDNVFVPFVSLFEEGKGEDGYDQADFFFFDLPRTPIFNFRDVNQFLGEQVRSLNEKFKVLSLTLYKEEEVLPPKEGETPVDGLCATKKTV